MVGIENTAEIRLNVKLDKKGLADLRRAMKTITTAMKTEKAAKDMRLLTNQIEKLKKELREAKKEFKNYQAGSKQAEKSNKSQAKSVEQLRKQTKTFFKSHNSDVKRYISDSKRAAKAQTDAAKRAAQAQKAQIAAQKRAAAAQVAAQRKAAAALKQQEIAQRRVEQQQRRYIATAQRASRSTKMFMQAHRVTAPAVQKTTAEINKERMAHQRNIMSVERHRVAWQKFTQQRKNANRLFTRMNKSLSDAEHEMDALFRASFRLSIVGMTLQRFAQNIIGWGTSILDVFEEFEYTSLRAAGALEIWNDTMIDGRSGTELLQEKVVDLAGTLRLFTAEEVARGLYFWGSATGQVVNSTEELEVALTGMEAIMKAAAMTNTDYETTIKGVYSILTQFYGGSLEYTTEVTEKLFLSTQKTAAEFTDLIGSFKMVGPVAAQAGADFDMVNKAFGDLSDLGLRGSMAGRGLRQLFIQLVRPSGPAQKKWSELFENNPFDTFDGKSMRDVLFPEGEFIGISEAMWELARATEHLDPAGRLQAIARVTTANSLPLTIALIAKTRNEMLGLTDAVDKFKDADPATYFENSWEQLSTSWRGFKESFLRGIEAIKLTLGADMAKALKPLVDYANDLLAKFREFAAMHPEITRLVTQFAAIVAAVSMVGGAVFMAAGAIVGLAAAFGLIWRATEQFRKTLFAVGKVFSVVVYAIVSNLDVIYNAAVRIIANIEEVFSSAGMSIEDFGDIIDNVLSPVHDMTRAIVILISEVVVIATEVAAFVANLIPLGPAIDIVTNALKVFIGFKIFEKLRLIAWGYATMYKAAAGPAASSFIASLKLMRTNMSAMFATGMIGGIKALTTALRGLFSMSLGPLGMLLTAIFVFGDELPIIGDLIKHVTGQFRDLNAEMNAATKYFGESADVIENVARGIASSTPRLNAAKGELTELGKSFNQFVKDVGMADDERVTLLTPDMSTDEIIEAVAAFGQFSNAWSGSTELGDEWFAVSTAIGQGEKAVVEASNSVLTEVTNFGVEWRETHEGLSKEIALAGRDIAISADDYGLGVSRLLDNVTGRYDVLGSGYTPQGSIVDDLMRSLWFGAPDKMTVAEAQAYLDEWNKLNASVLSEAVQLPEFLDIMGGRVGDYSSSVNDSLIAAVNEMMQITDPYALREAVTTPLEGILPDNMTVFDTMGDYENYGDAQPILQFLMGHWDAVQADLEGGASDLGMDVIESRLKNTLEVMTTNLLKNALPDLTEISETVMQLGLANTDESYRELADVFLEAYGDGQTLAEMVTSGQFKGASISTLKEIAQLLVDNGYGSDALERFLAADSSEAGLEAGENTARNWNDWYLEGLAGLGELSWKDFKEATKLGTVKKRLRQAGRLIERQANWEGPWTPEARAQQRETIQTTGRAATRAVKTKKKRGNVKGARKQARQGVRSVVPKNLMAQPDNIKQAVITQLRNLAAEMPGVVANEVENLPGLTELQQQAILAAIFPPPPPPVLEDALETLMGTAEGGEGGGTDIRAIAAEAKAGVMEEVSAAMFGTTETVEGEAPAAPAGENPFANTIAQLIQAVPDVASIVTSAAAVGTDIQTLIMNGLGALAEDEGALKNIGNFMSFVSAGIMSEEDASEYFKHSGEYLGLSNTAGFIKGLLDNKGSITTGITTTNSQAVAPAIPIAYLQAVPVGESLGQGIADGIKNKKGAIDSAIESATASGKGASPPKTGPLQNIDKWGQNIGTAWSDGVAKGMARGEDQILQANTFSDMEVTHKGKKEVLVRLEVTSPDGSVNRQKEGEIRRAALEAFSVAGLEHMVTVG